MPQVVYQYFAGTSNQDIRTDGYRTYEMTRISGNWPSAPYKITSAYINFSRVYAYSIKRYLEIYSNSEAVNATLVTTQVLQLYIGEGYSNDVTFTLDPNINYAGLTRINIKAHNGPNTSGTGAAIQIPSSSYITITVNYEVLQSGLTLNKSSMDAGQTIRANISAGDASYTHRITWRFVGREQVDAVAAGVAYKDFLVPEPWLDQIPATLQGTMSVTLETLSGSTVVGSVTGYVTITVGAGVVPAIGSLTASKINNAVPPAWDMFLAGVSQVLLTVGGVGAGTGSSIASYSITGPGLSVNAAQGTTTILPIGIHEYTATVADLRGRTATKKIQITVVDYYKPVTNWASSSRCDSAGNQNGSGTYIKVQLSYDFAVLSGKNSVTVDIKYRLSGASTWTSAFNGALANGGSKVIGGGGIATGSSYVVQYTVTDALGNTAVYVTTVGTAEVLIHKRAGGKGIGVGGYCEAEKRIQIPPDWDILGGILRPSTPLALIGGGTSGYDAASGCYNLEYRGFCANLNSAIYTGFYTTTPDTLGTWPASAFNKYGILRVYNTGHGTMNGYMVQELVSIIEPHIIRRRAHYDTNIGYSGWFKFTGTMD